MRCVLRVLLAGTVTVLVIFCVAIRSTSIDTVNEDYQVDEIRRLLNGDTNPTPPTRPQTPVSVIIVVVVCLISVALLIAGIVIVAITLDPNDEESDIESDCSSSSPCHRPEFYPREL